MEVKDEEEEVIDSKELEEEGELNESRTKKNVSFNIHVL